MSSISRDFELDLSLIVMVFIFNIVSYLITVCESGWVENTNTGSCNFISTEVLTWADANNVCNNMGVKLLVPDDRSSMQFLPGK